MAEPDLLIEVGFSDAKLAAEARKLVDKYRETGKAAEKAFQDATGKVSDSQAAQAHRRELDRLRRAYDPVYVATKKYEAEVNKLNRALEVGAIDQAKYAAEIRRIEVELGKANGMLQTAEPAVRNFGGSMQNVGYQVQDFAVQVASGTGATRAFAQQFPQLASAFGPWGVAIGTAAAVLVPLGAALLGAGEKAQTLDDQLEALEKSTDAMTAAAEAAATPIEELRQKYGDLADEVGRANQAMLAITAAAAKRDALAAARSLGGELGNDLPNMGAYLDPAGNVMRGYEAARAQLMAQAIEMLGKKTGATAEQARHLLDAISQLGRSDDVAGLVSELEALLSSISQVTAGTDAQQEALSDMAAQMGAVLDAAKAQVAAAADQTVLDQDRVIAKYAETTAKLKEMAAERAVLEEAAKSHDADRAAAAREALVALDAQIAKLRELAAQGDVSFGSLIERARSFVSALGQGIVDAVREGDDAAANSGILALIRRRESGGDYNAQWGGGAYSGGARDFVNMTVREVLAVQREMLRHPGNTANSSAVGAYQIVGTTLGGEKLDGTGGLVAKLQISLDEQFTPQLQDRLARELLRAARPGGVDRLRGVWTGLQGVPDAVIQGALGNEVVPRVDPEVEKAQAKAQSDRQKALEAETRERDRQIAQALQYGEQLAATLVTEKQRAELERQRSEAIAAITASDLSEADKAAAIVEVNGEMQKQLTIMALLEEAKRRGVDLDARMIDSALTYRQAIEAVGEAQKQKVVTDQQVATSTAQVADRTQAARDVSDNFNRTLYDALMASDSLDDALRRLALSFVEMAGQALIMGQGPLATLFGISGGLFNFGGAAPAGAGAGGFGGFRAAGGPVSPSRAYVVGERGPEIFVPRLPGDIIPHGRGVVSGSGGIATININLAGANGDRAIAEIARASVMQGLMEYDEALPGRVRQVNRDPRKLGRG